MVLGGRYTVSAATLGKLSILLPPSDSTKKTTSPSSSPTSSSSSTSSASLLALALDILDRSLLTRVVDEVYGRSCVLVASRTSSTVHRVLGSHHCTCKAFVYSVLTGATPFCKHQLSALLSSAGVGTPPPTLVLSSQDYSHLLLAPPDALTLPSIS